ncbi:MAG: trehalose-6-phosphate synthase [Acidimicrobiales bacterium]
MADRERDLAERRREHLILRVDRADPSKNILRGFKAYDTMLADHPELRGRVTFLALVQPSRGDVEQYVDYLEAIRGAVAQVNDRHGNAEWQPVELSLEGDFDEVVAAYRSFDVLVVNPVADGMNLVAKEAALLNTNDGVLALSENAGAHEELGEFAVTLYPFDTQQQADAMFAALTMDPQQRRDRPQPQPAPRSGRTTSPSGPRTSCATCASCAGRRRENAQVWAYDRPMTASTAAPARCRA